MSIVDARLLLLLLFVIVSGVFVVVVGKHRINGAFLKLPNTMANNATYLKCPNINLTVQYLSNLQCYDALNELVNLLFLVSFRFFPFICCFCFFVLFWCEYKHDVQCTQQYTMVNINIHSVYYTHIVQKLRMRT